MSAPSKAKQQRIPLERGDFIVTKGDIIDGAIILPVLDLRETPDATMEPYLLEIAKILNLPDKIATSFRCQLTGLPRNCRVDIPYLQNHFDKQIGKISVQANQEDQVFTLFFHRYKMHWEQEQPERIKIGVINADEPPPRSILRRIRNHKRNRC